MTNIEKWNLIVNGYRDLYTSLESRLQNEWEMYCTELFGYKKLLHEVDAQRHLTVGAGGAIIPDIILRIDGKDIFDIELKQYNFSFQETFQTQLISYLNQTHLSVGMIVCDKIYLYYYEYATVTINKIEILFKENNPDGIALMEMLTKETFSLQKIRDFILKKVQREKNILEIKQSLTSENVKAIVKGKLLEQYIESDIDSVLDALMFKMVSLSSIVEEPPISGTPLSGDILSMIRNWCEIKRQKGEIGFQSCFSTKKYTRFTTENFDKIIPCQSEFKSGWNNGHFYFYEIVYYNGRLKMQISFSNLNAPKSIRAIYKRIMEVTRKSPQKENWQWWTIFSSKTFVCDGEISETKLFNELDRQFGQLQEEVLRLLKDLQ